MVGLVRNGRLLGWTGDGCTASSATGHGLERSRRARSQNTPAQPRLSHGLPQATRSTTAGLLLATTDMRDRRRTALGVAIRPPNTAHPGALGVVHKLHTEAGQLLP